MLWIEREPRGVLLALRQLQVHFETFTVGWFDQSWTTWSTE
jgi:hypothetical protein